MPPKLTRSCGSLMTGSTSGHSGRPLTSGYSAGLAEALGQRQQLLRRELLIAEEDHDVLEQGGAQLLDRVVVERLGEIDAEDLGAERAGERADFQTGSGHQRHGRSPRGASLHRH